jgi:hypothetical protein
MEKKEEHKGRSKQKQLFRTDMGREHDAACHSVLSGAQFDQNQITHEYNGYITTVTTDSYSQAPTHTTRT